MFILSLDLRSSKGGTGRMSDDNDDDHLVVGSCNLLVCSLDSGL